jgi:hypothetical protein
MTAADLWMQCDEMEANAKKRAQPLCQTRKIYCGKQELWLTRATRGVSSRQPSFLTRAASRET